MLSQKVLRVGCAGAGRAGKIHIQNIQRQRNARIVAVCTPDRNEQSWVSEHVPGAAIYSSYDKFIQHGHGSKSSPPLKMDCVFLCTPTKLHHEQLVGALKNGMHVFCEKPLSQDPDVAEAMYVEALRYPSIKVACAFPRRFDAGYVAMRQEIEKNTIGNIVALRSQTTDLIDHSPFFARYVSGSGGVFLDSAIHDIDAILFLLGGLKGAKGQGSDVVKPQRAFATGSATVFPSLSEYGDADNASGLIEFDGGVFAQVTCSRTNAHGHHSYTEVLGTSGKIVVNQEPRLLNLDISTSTGTCVKAARDHLELFESAFETEVSAFLNWVAHDIPAQYSLRDAVLAVKIGAALQKSFRERRQITF